MKIKFTLVFIEDEKNLCALRKEFAYKTILCD